jgi:hypothetical protein
MRVSGPVVDAGWLEEELSELEQLVDGGETLEVVSRLSAMMRAPRLAEPVGEDTLSEQTLS